MREFTGEYSWGFSNFKLSFEEDEVSYNISSILIISIIGGILFIIFIYCFAKSFKKE
jgi:hypothetical protein